MKTLNFSIDHHIAKVEFNRPDAANALNEQSWVELNEVFKQINQIEVVRVVLLLGNGKNFCGGIDLSMLKQVLHGQNNCEGRLRENLLKTILRLQEAVSSIEKCKKPVIAAIQGACIGAGLDIIASCDMRYASADAFFSIKEVDMGMVADLGSLQRLPKILNDGILRELAFTGRKVLSMEAKELGLVNNIFQDRDSLYKEVQKIAELIVSKSPLAIRGIKENLNYSQNHSIEEGLIHVANWNAAMLISDDIKEIFNAQKEARKPQFID